VFDVLTPHTSAFRSSLHIDILWACHAFLPRNGLRDKQLEVSLGADVVAPYWSVLCVCNMWHLVLCLPLIQFTFWQQIFYFHREGLNDMYNVIRKQLDAEIQLRKVLHVTSNGNARCLKCQFFEMRFFLARDFLASAVTYSLSLLFSGNRKRAWVGKGHEGRKWSKSS